MEFPTPKPILFNFWKHHLSFLLDEIRNYQRKTDYQALRSSMKLIGNSTTDLYTGKMNIPEISEFCIKKLKENNRFEKSSYIKWINQNPEYYREMVFPDHSIWILKIGTEKDRHIHIHPGRNVPHTVRVKANILKTAFLTNLIAFKDHQSAMDVNLINTLRNDVLGLSPIKFVTMNHELGKMIYLFAHNLGIIDIT